MERESDRKEDEAVNIPMSFYSEPEKGGSQAAWRFGQKRLIVALPDSKKFKLAFSSIHSFSETQSPLYNNTVKRDNSGLAF